MVIYSVYDKEFEEYGRVIEADFTELLSVLATKPCPSRGTVYVASDSDLEGVKACKDMRIEVFGGQPIEAGYCNGSNKALNCLEYHKNSEVNVFESDTVLLLGRLQDIKDSKYNTSLVKAFLIPAGKGVELYATTLHYAPCRAEGTFRMVVILPEGTNAERPADAKSPLLWARNKWLLAHECSMEAKQGAYIGLVGKNIEI